MITAAAVRDHTRVIVDELSKDAGSVDRAAAAMVEVASALQDAIALGRHTRPNELRQSAVLIRGALIQVMLAALNASARAERLHALADLLESQSSNGTGHG